MVEKIQQRYFNFFNSRFIEIGSVDIVQQVHFNAFNGYALTHNSKKIPHGSEFKKQRWGELEKLFRKLHKDSTNNTKLSKIIRLDDEKPTITIANFPGKSLQCNNGKAE
ncbi:unnamed protein product [Ceratitis capitata]|uniref:(Mediterranean fruit fly) hypothetical protein n=1 Tax=Ceratitis capitata TaxID=7213 RepID=A0A811UAV4_CERCA|nr:unnamed protein product [Ceratitis capitata]